MDISDLNIDTDDHAECILVLSSTHKGLEKITALLEKHGYKIFKASSTRDALNIVLKNSIDLIILDYASLSEQADETLTYIRNDSCLRRSSLLILHNDPVSFSKDLDHNDIQVIANPPELSSFFVKISTCLRLRKFKAERIGFEAQLALQNSELRDLTNKFKHELREAKEIQTSLFPTKLPSVDKAVFAAYCAPLEAVGGDLFDIWQVDNDWFGLFIADVTGHGLPAAFIGAMTKMAMSYAPQKSPEVMLSHINLGLKRHIPDGRFVTAEAASYQASSGLLRLARGGHPYAMIYRASSKTVDEISPRGIPLGILEESVYELYETTLKQGDKLLMVSDGVTESVNMDGEMFGQFCAKECFRNAAQNNSIDKCISYILEEQTEFTGGRMLKDDITLIGLERL